VATAVLSERQVTGRPNSWRPAASRTLAEANYGLPTST
jgi:hypothetical protein